ncbi:MAG: NAD-binding protein [Anaerolineae bacterium]|jgi:voltage-gated potassium channel|nr:NAD-binding protein [Anaerolineae bacterium]
MTSYEETRRQIRIAAVLFLIILPTGVGGFMLIEGLSLSDSIWITVVTLATVGYGDIVPRTDLGRFFTIVLLLTGLGAFAFAGQAFLSLLFSPDLVRARQQARTVRLIRRLRGHYVIIGQGELVDRTVGFLADRAKQRRDAEARRIVQRIDRFLPSRLANLPVLRPLRLRLHSVLTARVRQRTLADLVVCITQSAECANDIRRMGMLVIEGDASDNAVLAAAGIDHAMALMVMEDDDMETLLTVLTANTQNPNLMITCGVQDDSFSPKLMRAGANHVINPSDIAAQFLNNLTFRPAVNEFFSSILFDQKAGGWHVLQIFMEDDSPWLGRKVRDLNLQARFKGAGLLGVRRGDGSYAYSFTPDDFFEEDEVVLVIAPEEVIPALLRESRPNRAYRGLGNIWQRLIVAEPETRGTRGLTLAEAQQSAGKLRDHFIICAGGAVADGALHRLAPDRPFVVICPDAARAEGLLARGFRVIVGRTTDDDTLRQAGIERALAIMVALEDKASSVMTTLTSRALSKRTLITATAQSDDMAAKLYRAGADRVISPSQIAAQFLLLATTRPVVSDFMNYVLYNRATGLETTELYIEEDSPWVNQTIAALAVTRDYDARIIGIRDPVQGVLYGPDESHVIRTGQVVIAITTMRQSDELREFAYGAAHRRPQTLRTTAR